MGHILLVILKFIGILLASILGLILFLILLVLLAPIGYSAKGEKGAETVCFQGKISWFIAVLRCKFLYSEEGFQWSLRIFGILAFGNSEKIQQRKAKKIRKKEKKKTSKEILAPEVIKEVKQMPQAEASEETKEVPKLETLKEQKTLYKSKIPDKKTRIREKISKLKKKFSEFKNKVLRLPKQLTAIKENLQQKKEKLEQIHKFWLAETTQDAKRKLIQEGKKMFVHILPNKLKGELEIGLSDPYVMGQVLAVLGILMPLYQDKLLVRPNFEEEKFQGKLFFRGRIIPGYLIGKGLILFFNKKIRKTIKEGKQLIGGN